MKCIAKNCNNDAIDRSNYCKDHKPGKIIKRVAKKMAKKASVRKVAKRGR